MSFTCTLETEIKIARKEISEYLKKKYLEQRKEIKSRIDFLETKREKSGINLREHQECQKLKEKFQSFVDLSQEFESKTIEFLNETETAVKIFGGKRGEVKKNEKEEEFKRKKILTLKRFQDISSKYVQITLLVEKEKTFCCPSCDFNLEDLTTEITTECPNCHRLFTHSSLSTSDYETINSDTRIDNYLTFLQEYQGIGVSIPSDVLDQINETLRKNGYPTSEKIRKHPEKYALKKDLTREGTSFEMLYNVLKKLKFAAYYRLINYIGHLIWDWKLPDISHLEKRITEDHAISLEKWKIVTEGKRKSAMSVTQKLYCDLWRYRNEIDFELVQSNFKHSETPAIYQANCIYQNRLCEMLEWDSPYIENEKKEVITFGRKRE